jgi:cytochrome c-type biogenesis protein CcmF
VPIALLLILLTGVGPLIAWRKSSLSSLKKAFLFPSVVGLAVTVALAAMGITHVAALISFGLCAFVVATILIEFWKGSRAIQSKEQISLPRAAFELTWRNTRRYGGYIVHMGIVFMFIGFTGSAFNQHETRQLGLNQTLRFGRYDLKLTNVNDGEDSNVEFSRASLDVGINGRLVTDLHPEIRLYKASQEQASMIGIRRRLNEDLYVNFSGISPDNTKAIFQIYIFPLVSCIWIGYWVLLAGTVICLIPGKVRLQYARTEVVGIASAAQTVKP